jgi:hypothetical protein
MGGEFTTGIIIFTVKPQVYYVTEICDEMFLDWLCCINVVQINTIITEQAGVAVVQ